MVIIWKVLYWTCYVLTWYVSFVAYVLLARVRARSLSHWQAKYMYCNIVMHRLVFPLVQGYAVAGQFSFGAKLLNSIKGNLLFYGVCAAVLVVFVIFYLWNTGISVGYAVETHIARAREREKFVNGAD
jgi:hypothetical protein